MLSRVWNHQLTILPQNWGQNWVRSMEYIQEGPTWLPQLDAAIISSAVDAPVICSLTEF